MRRKYSKKKISIKKKSEEKRPEIKSKTSFEEETMNRISEHRKTTQIDRKKKKKANKGNLRKQENQIRRDKK